MELCPICIYEHRTNYSKSGKTCDDEICFGTREENNPEIDIDQMRDTFHTITDGAYSNLLYELFTKERVEAELEKFLEFDFFPRVGGGIGMTRMIAALDTLSEAQMAAE